MPTANPAALKEKTICQHTQAHLFHAPILSVSLREPIMMGGEEVEQFTFTANSCHESLLALLEEHGTSLENAMVEKIGSSPRPCPCDRSAYWVI